MLHTPIWVEIPVKLRKLNVNSLLLRYALVASIILFVLVASMSGSEVFACFGHSCPPPPPPPPPPSGGHNRDRNVGSTLVIHEKVIVSVIVISQVTVTIPVLRVVNQFVLAPTNMPQEVPSASSGLGIEFYGLLFSALAMLGAAAGFGFYAPMYDVPADVTQGSPDDTGGTAGPGFYAPMSGTPGGSTIHGHTIHGHHNSRTIQQYYQQQHSRPIKEHQPNQQHNSRTIQQYYQQQHSRPIKEHQPNQQHNLRTIKYN